MGDLITLTRSHKVGVFLYVTRSRYLVCIVVSDSCCYPWVTPLVLTRSMQVGDSARMTRSMLLGD